MKRQKRSKIEYGVIGLACAAGGWIAIVTYGQDDVAELDRLQSQYEREMAQIDRELLQLQIDADGPEEWQLKVEQWSQENAHRVEEHGELASWLDENIPQPIPGKNEDEAGVLPDDDRLEEEVRMAEIDREIDEKSVQLWEQTQDPKTWQRELARWEKGEGRALFAEIEELRRDIGQQKPRWEVKPIELEPLRADATEDEVASAALEEKILEDQLGVSAAMQDASAEEWQRAHGQLEIEQADDIAELKRLAAKIHRESLHRRVREIDEFLKNQP